MTFFCATVHGRGQFGGSLEFPFLHEAQIMPQCPTHLVHSGESQNNAAVLYSSATDRSDMYAEMVGHREILVLPKTESQMPPASRYRSRKPVALLPVDKRCLHIRFCRFPNTSLPPPSPVP